MPVAARQHEVVVRPSFCLELIERLDQTNVVLGGMLQPCNVQKKWMTQAETFGGEGLGVFARAWTKTLVIKPVVNHGQLFFRQPKEFHYIARCVVADRDDPVLTPRQPSRDHAAVENSLPVVFVGDAKRREVVNCGDQRAWPR